VKLHEYQAKQLLRERAISVPESQVVSSVNEAVAAAQVLGGGRWVIKAQVHAGGRGKAGGVALVDSAEAVGEVADRLLGSRLQTIQTGSSGLPVHHLLIERPTAIGRELYLSLLVDRAAERVLFMASDAGGMDIEEVARSTPGRIHRAHLDPAAGLQPYQARRIGFALGLGGAQIRSLQGIMFALFRLFNECDASLIEINPLVVTDEGALVALDAKINLDDNALFRHPNLAALRDESQEDPQEAAARVHDLNYITLDGDIGCMVNGAGLAMATMDLVKLRGGQPANFLDVGGGTTAERVAEAFKLLLADVKVRAVLVNIFGGIVRCDLIAEGIIRAIEDVKVGVPVVARLEGTNAAQGLARLADSGLAVITASGLDEAARRVVEVAQEGRR